MHSTQVLQGSDLAAEVADLQDAIATRVAAALEAGGPTWDVTAPLVNSLLDRQYAGAPPVVLARALSRAQRCRATAAERALERGDRTAAEAIVSSLRHASDRLAGILGGPPAPE